MATKKGKGSGGRRKPDHGVGEGVVFESVFASTGDEIIPGELIVQLDEGTAGAITESIPRGPSRSTGFSSVARFGVTALDTALTKLKVRSVTRLHPPAPRVQGTFGMRSADATGAAEAVALAATFKVAFDASISVEKAVEILSAVAGVQFAEPNRWREASIVPNDPSYVAQWGLARINCPTAWDRTTGVPGVVVAVVDTGVDLDHPELAPLLLRGADMVDLGPNPQMPGWRFEGDFQGRDNVPQDEVGHGTHVAGTIACLSNNGRGVAGVTWNCRLLPVKVLTRVVRLADGRVSGVGSSADIAAGIRWSVDNGARVINLSLGGTVGTQVERDAVAYAVARNVLVVAAMGNDGPAAGPSFPAAFPDVVAVGAIGQNDRRAGFSQVGAHIDIAAPGVGILSTVWDNGTATMDGTSMASPHVAGVAALVMSCNTNLTAAQVADILRQTARPLRDNVSDPVPNNQYGFGCVDAAAAVARACPNRVSRPILSCPRRSVMLVCPPTSPVNCVRSTAPVSCRPTVTIQLCGVQTTPVTCLQSALVTCRPTVIVQQCGVQTNTISCRPSLAVRCQTTLQCGGRIRPGDPFQTGDAMGADGNGYCGGEDWADPAWSDADPYAAGYGDDDLGANEPEI